MRLCGGPFTKVEIVEPGPLRAVLRLAGAHQGAFEEWEFEWQASSPWLIWQARMAAPRDE